VELADGTRVFVKAATTSDTAAWLRNEHVAIRAAPRCAPRMVAWRDDRNDEPMLITECLQGHWPASHAGVEWRAGDLERVFAALRELASLPPPSGLTASTASTTEHWRELSRRVDAVVALGLCTRAWLERNIDALARAEARLDRTGSAFVHGDVRSDNICLLDDRVCFVDWSNAHAGASETDLATFLPTAHLEGGPAPYSILPNAAPWAAMQSGDLIRRAIDETTSAPAWLQRVFRRLAGINLDWAAASLGLPRREVVA
jgi:aminoglycoside phosphotransferase (APT) family kinase protein